MGYWKSAKGDFLALHQNDIPIDFQKIIDEVYQADDLDVLIIPAEVEKYVLNSFKIKHKTCKRRLNSSYI